MAANWNIENRAEEQMIRLTSGAVVCDLPYGTAAKLATRILGFTSGAATSSASRSATPKGQAPVATSGPAAGTSTSTRRGGKGN